VGICVCPSLCIIIGIKAFLFDPAPSNSSFSLIIIPYLFPGYIYNQPQSGDQKKGKGKEDRKKRKEGPDFPYSGPSLTRPVPGPNHTSLSLYLSQQESLSFLSTPVTTTTTTTYSYRPVPRPSNRQTRLAKDTGRAGGALMPPKAKRNNANQHDKRHESGLAAPGKRISKQRSNSALNGNGGVSSKAGAGGPSPSSSSASSSVPPPPLPSTGLNQGLVFPRPANVNSTETVMTGGGAGGAGGSAGSGSGPGSGSGFSGDDGTAVCTGRLGGDDTARSSSQVSVEDDGGFSSSTMTSRGLAEDAAAGAATAAAASITTTTTRVPRRVSEAPSYRISTTSSASSTLAMAATILSSCPLRDAIAILILLLSLPPLWSSPSTLFSPLSRLSLRPLPILHGTRFPLSRQSETGSMPRRPGVPRSLQC